MSVLSNLTAAVFDQGAEQRLSEDAEREALHAAQRGDEKAKVALVLAYAPALRNAVATYTRALPAAPRREDLEDVRSNVLVGLLEAIEAWDGEVHRRLAAIAPQYLRNAMSASAASATQFHVPERTLKRFFGILRAAEGDVARAALIAPEHEMKAETFLAVLDAVRNVESFDGLTAAEDEFGRATQGGQSAAASRGLLGASLSAPNPIADVEDAILVEAALRAVDETERVVVGLAYGFADYEPVPDAEIGERLGMSRPKVQRVRAGALGKMRDSLGVSA